MRWLRDDLIGRLGAASLGAVLLAACGGDTTAPPVSDGSALAEVASDGGQGSLDASADAGPRHPLDDLLRLNHLQLRGTHNSYHVRGEVVAHPDHDYDHAPLDVQLEGQGVRAFELDVHAPEQGEGFLVYHLYFVDQATTCETFRDCLAVIKGWSDAHREHLPIAIWVEVKDENGGPTIGDIRLLDEEIRAVFPPQRLLTPDDVRGPRPSLRAALEADGWPTLGAARGRVMVILMETGRHRATYLDGAPDLAGRAMFVRAAPTEFGQPWAAAAKINDPGAAAEIEAAHAANVLVASNACLAGDEELCAAKAAAAVANGVHFVKTDFPVADPQSGAYLDLPDAAPARCNGVTAPPGCVPEALERL